MISRSVSSYNSISQSYISQSVSCIYHLCACDLPNPKEKPVLLFLSWSLANISPPPSIVKAPVNNSNKSFFRTIEGGGVAWLLVWLVEERRLVAAEAMDRTADVIDPPPPPPPPVPGIGGNPMTTLGVGRSENTKGEGVCVDGCVWMGV